MLHKEDKFKRWQCFESIIIIIWTFIFPYTYSYIVFNCFNYYHVDLYVIFDEVEWWVMECTVSSSTSFLLICRVNHKYRLIAADWLIFIKKLNEKKKIRKPVINFFIQLRTEINFADLFFEWGVVTTLLPTPFPQALRKPIHSDWKYSRNCYEILPELHIIKI